MRMESGPQHNQENLTVLKSTRGEAVAVRSAFENLRSDLPLAEALLLTTLPRGELQIMHAMVSGEAVAKHYHRRAHTQDGLAWSALQKNAAVRLSDLPESNAAHAGVASEPFRPTAVKYGLALPVSDPVLPGYPGVLELWRSADQGDFDDAAVQTAVAFARDLSEALASSLETRSNGAVKLDVSGRVFAFDRTGRALFPASGLNGLDPRIGQALARHVVDRINAGADPEAGPDRVSFPDSRNDHSAFRIAVHPSFPALSDGPVVIASLVPHASDWGLLRPADFSADSELARLVPATKFVLENFARGPTLTEISRVVHLSPFHFHRRFAELLGITPKHFLFDCQIELAKKLLADRQTDLAEIARTCGFAHQSHFTSRFKQATGLTPTKWRAAMANN